MGKYSRTIDIKPPMLGRRIIDGVHSVADENEAYYRMDPPALGVFELVNRTAASPRQALLVQSGEGSTIEPAESYGKVCVVEGELHDKVQKAPDSFSPARAVDRFVGELAARLA